MSPRSLVAFAFALALGGCPSSESTPIDLSIPADLAPYACPPLSSYCGAAATRPECATYSKAAWCAADGGLPSGYSPPTLQQCGPYVLILVASADVSTSYVYDATTGALVAVLQHDYDGRTTCMAGPASLSLSCAPMLTPLCG